MDEDESAQEINLPLILDLTLSKGESILNSTTNHTIASGLDKLDCIQRDVEAELEGLRKLFRIQQLETGIISSPLYQECPEVQTSTSTYYDNQSSDFFPAPSKYLPTEGCQLDLPNDNSELYHLFSNADWQVDEDTESFSRYSSKNLFHEYPASGQYYEENTLEQAKEKIKDTKQKIYPSCFNANEAYKSCNEKLGNAENHAKKLEAAVQSGTNTVREIRSITDKNWENIAKQFESDLRRVKKKLDDKESEANRLRNELSRALQAQFDSDDRLFRKTDAAIERNKELKDLLETAHANNKVLLSQVITQKKSCEELKDFWNSQKLNDDEIKREYKKQIASLNDKLEMEQKSRHQANGQLYTLWESKKNREDDIVTKLKKELEEKDEVIQRLMKKLNDQYVDAVLLSNNAISPIIDLSDLDENTNLTAPLKFKNDKKEELEEGESVVESLEATTSKSNKDTANEADKTKKKLKKRVKPVMPAKHLSTISSIRSSRSTIIPPKNKITSTLATPKKWI